MAEEREEALSASQDDDGASQGLEEGSRGYLTPLQKSLLYELTTRKYRIASAHSRADFWQKRQAERSRDRFDSDVLDETVLNELIVERKKELTRLKEARQLKLSTIEAADAAHAVNASMSTYSPSIHDSGVQDRPLSRLPLRYLAAERDELAFEYLGVDAQIKEVRRERSEMANKINATEKQTSSLIEQVQRRAEAIQQRQKDELQSTAKRDEKSTALKEALQAARGKRELVKGVLRGLILESGLDWSGNQDLRKLLLELNKDDDLDASDDEPDFDSGSEGDAEG